MWPSILLIAFLMNSGNEEHWGGEVALEFCFSLVRKTMQLYLFGISDGTLGEARTAIESNISIRLYRLLRFDPDWREEYRKKVAKYGYLLDDLFRQNNLI